VTEHACSTERLLEVQNPRAGERLTAARLAGLGNCASALFTCIQIKPDDQKCLDKANASCGKELAKLDGKVAKIEATLDKACAAVNFATLRADDAMFFDALSQQCAVGTNTLESFADYRECLMRRHVCETEDLTRLVVPRSAELFSVVGREFGSPFCCPP